MGSPFVREDVLLLEKLGSFDGFGGGLGGRGFLLFVGDAEIV
jgi:hypothetical protein